MEPLVSTSEAEFGALGPGEPSSSSHSRPRAPWTPMEHEVFLKALAQHGRDWRRVSAVLQEAAAGRGDCGAARSLAQVRIWGGERGASGRFGSGGRRRGMEKMRRRISAAAVFFFFFFGSRARFLGLLHADVSPGPPRASFSAIRMMRPEMHRKREGQARFGGGFARNRPRGKLIFSRQSRKEKEGKKSASDALRQRATRERREPHRPSKDFLPLALILNDV